MFRLFLFFTLIAFSAAAQIAGREAEFSRLDADAEQAYLAGDYDKALSLSEAARAIAEANIPAGSQLTFDLWGRLGIVNELRGNYEEAAGAYRKLLVNIEAALGKGGINSAFPMEMLGRVLCKQGKELHEAENLFKSVVELRKPMIVGGEDAFKATNDLNFAILELARGNSQEALSHYRAVVADIARRGSLPTSDSTFANTDPTNTETFVGLAAAAWQIAQSDPSLAPAMADEAFVAAQWKWRTAAAAALAQAAARSGSGAHAAQMRKVQDMAVELKALDAELEAHTQGWLTKLASDPVYSELEKQHQAAMPSSDEAIGDINGMLDQSKKLEELSQKYSTLMEQCGYSPECAEKHKGLQQQLESMIASVGPPTTGSTPEKENNAKLERTLREQMEARQRQIPGWDAYQKGNVDIYERRGRLGAELERQKAVLARVPSDAPAAAPFEDARPISIPEAQASLGDGEALVFYLIGRDETFVWALTRSDSRWRRLATGAATLDREVTALRCGLDYDGTWTLATSPCPQLLGVAYGEAERDAGKPLPFDTQRAHALYKTLFDPVADLVTGNSLLLVPTGALARLPFQVLITQDPAGAAGDAAFKQAHWLVRDHALTVLPSPSSLKTLRQQPPASAASRKMLGFGNPLLDGPDASFAEWASAARAKSACAPAPTAQIAAHAGGRSVRAFDLKGGLANTAEIRAQAPLPETADELCAVARDLGVAPEDVHLAARATETEIKRMSDAGDLAQYRVLHFATHGALAGQVSGSSEPGLLLTPPEKATARDDGYLTATEIAALKANADWVILSACNTAASGAQGDEQLSGMAQAFFYAGARALLVSHWAVYSEATVKLITKALAAVATDKTAGRAEAMRRAMLALIDTGGPAEAHPSYWAPFIVVGEGSARAQ